MDYNKLYHHAPYTLQWRLRAAATFAVSQNLPNFYHVPNFDTLKRRANETFTPT
jgi:hypothetical protein